MVGPVTYHVLYSLRHWLHYSNIHSRTHPTLLDIVNQDFTLFFDLEEQTEQRVRQLINEALLDTNSQYKYWCTPPMQYDRVFIPNCMDPRKPYVVISCCNGIICLYQDHVVFLWNPSIDQFKKITFPNLDAYNFSILETTTMILFGYDYVSDDYKLLKIVYQKNEDDFIPIVQLYSTKADCFKEFQAPVLKNIITLNSNLLKNVEPTYVVIDGVLYFDGDDKIVSFDLHKEAFGIVPFPSFIERKRSAVLDFEGSLAIVIQSGPGDVDLWTLPDFSGKLSWTKKFSFGCALDDSDTEIWLSSYVGAGQFYGIKLLNGDHFLYEVMYDYEKKDIKSYGLEEYVGNDATEDLNILDHATHKYTKTLVSLNGFERVKYLSWEDFL